MLLHKLVGMIIYKSKKLLISLGKKGLMALMLLLVVACTTLAQVKLGQLKPEYTKILGISIGYPSFQTIIKRFGRAKQFTQQIECCKNTYLCYKSKASKNTLAVVFEGNSVDKTVESIYVSQYNAIADLLSYVHGELKMGSLKVYCTASDKIPKNISMGDLVLGIPRGQLYKEWGNPSYSDDNIMIYEYYADGKMNDKLITRFKKIYPNLNINKFPYVEISSRIKLLFKDDKLVGFGIHRSFIPSNRKFYPDKSNPLKP